jgi:RNA recognition motif-containing protein
MERLLFIEKLPVSVTASDLTTLFSLAGNVQWARVLKLSCQDRFACGIVEMTTTDAAEAALALLNWRRHFGVRLSIEPLFSPAAAYLDDYSTCSGRA